MSQRNPYFQQYNAKNPEWDIYNNASDEVVKQYGIPLKYLIRTHIEVDNILGEDPISKYTEAIDVVMYLDNYTNFEGQGDLFQKFGMQVDDQMTLVCQQKYLDDTLGEEPQVGDLIFFGFDKALFEIFHVDPEKDSFYFFGKQMLYKIQCRKYEYSGESIATGDTDIDLIDAFNDVNTTDEKTEMDTEESSKLDFSETDPFNNF